MMMTRSDAVKFLTNKPYKLGHMVGFTKLTTLHNNWIKDMVRGKQSEMTLLAHRGSYKTTCVAIALALIMVLFPNYHVLFIRKTDSNVKEVVRQVRNILMHPKMQAFIMAIYGQDVVFEITKDTDNEISTNLCIDTKGTSQLLGIGIGSSVTGKHYDIIFTDDIVTLEDRQSRAEREKTKIFYQELMNILNRDERCRVINTGTTWHKEDCIEELMQNKQYFDCYSTGLMSEEDIEDKRGRMLPSLFAANYELKYIASEDVIFTNPKRGGTIEDVKNGIMHLDSAFYGDDFTAYTAANVHDGKIYVYGKLKRKHVEDCYPQITKMYNETLCTKLYNEENADKGLVGRDLRKEGLKVVLYHEKMNKHVKIVTHLYAIWRDVVFVEGTDEEYIEQICDYTEDAAHDDAPDSLACIARLLEKKKARTDNSSPYLL